MAVVDDQWLIRQPWIRLTFYGDGEGGNQNASDAHWHASGNRRGGQL
jgi:hypothetical protein